MAQQQENQKPRMDIMLDIETLGTEPGSIILSVAMKSFSLNPDEEICPRIDYERTINVLSSLVLHLSSDYKTEEWWSQPERKEAYAKILDVQQVAVNVEIVMPQVRHIISEFNTDYDIYIWGRGVGSFDIPLLEEAIKRVWLKQHPDKTELEYKPTFPFYKAMDVRTLVNFCKALGMTPEKRDTPHEAMADVEKQIAEVHECIRFLNPDK